MQLRQRTLPKIWIDINFLLTWSLTVIRSRHWHLELTLLLKKLCGYTENWEHTPEVSDVFLKGPFIRAIITVIFRCDFFGEENRSKLAVKLEHVQNIYDIAVT